MVDKRPKLVIITALLWLVLSVIFIIWGGFSLSMVFQIPGWNEIPTLKPMLHFGYLMATIVWFVFAAIFIIFVYNIFKGKSWVWTTGLIISTIFLVIFALMLAPLMVNAVMFMDPFSILGLITVVISFIIDLGIVFCLTRPITKIYFDVK